MKFLVSSKPKFPVPPEAAPMLLEAMRGWVKKYTASRQIEQIWGYAVGGGGGGILNVASSEELNAVMTELPFGPFSETAVYPILPIEVSLDSFEQAMKRMAPRK